MKKGMALVLIILPILVLFILVLFFIGMKKENDMREKKVDQEFSEIDYAAFAIPIFQQDAGGRSLALQIALAYADAKDYDRFKTMIDQSLQMLFNHETCWRMTVASDPPLERLGTCLGKSHNARFLIPSAYSDGLHPLQVKLEVW
ncbi:MAG: hypothetical protein V1735_03640 [Nanoarchaeota archaeon]